MATIYPALPRLSVRDSFDEDELSDVDDEVFIRDGKNGGFKLNDDSGVKRPLMAPRRKTKTSRINNSQKLPCKALFAPFCYGLLALLVLLGLIVACIYTVNLFPVPLSILKNWLSGTEKTLDVTPDFVVPCTSLTSTVVWTRTLPKFTSEAPFRGNDVNGDEVEDVIVGFSTGLDAIDAPEYLCDLYFDGMKPCLGGIMALDGKSGDTIWTYWTSHAIFNVDCAMDITNDGVKDCLITGRGGILHAVDGNLGTNIWKLDTGEDTVSSDEESILDVYDATYMNDVDSDNIGDIVASHTVQFGELLSSEILVISGKTGNIMSRVDFPRKEELFIAPRPLLHPDGEIMFVLVSSTPEKSGGLYVVSYSKLIHGRLQVHELYWGIGKGILLPPILTDITSDGTEDIIVATVNATIAAFNGLNFQPIWNYTVPGTEIISIPIPGYYNDDDVPDFMVKHQVGPGYPLYYYAVSTILNGKNGTPLLEKPLIDSLSGQMSGLSVSVDDFGNDWFLHWSSNCLNYEGAHEKYRFLQGQSLLSQSRADLCKLLYNTTLVTRLWALSQHVGPPGQSLYYSEDWKAVEYNNSINPREEADEYLRNHDNFDGLNHILDSGLSFVSERSPSIDQTHRESSSFQHKVSEGKDVHGEPKTRDESSASAKTKNPCKEQENAKNNPWEGSWAGPKTWPGPDFEQDDAMTRHESSASAKANDPCKEQENVNAKNNPWEGSWAGPKTWPGPDFEQDDTITRRESSASAKANDPCKEQENVNAKNNPWEGSWAGPKTWPGVDFEQDDAMTRHESSASAKTNDPCTKPENVNAKKKSQDNSWAGPKTWPSPDFEQDDAMTRHESSASAKTNDPCMEPKNVNAKNKPRDDSWAGPKTWPSPDFEQDDAMTRHENSASAKANDPCKEQENLNAQNNPWEGSWAGPKTWPGVDFEQDDAMTRHENSASAKTNDPYKEPENFDAKNKPRDDSWAGPKTWPGVDFEQDDAMTRYDSSASAKTNDPYKESENFKSIPRDDSWAGPKTWPEVEFRRDHTMYENTEDEFDPAEVLHVNNVRKERSDSTLNENARDNRSHSLDNQYDPNMDYTNGGSKYVEYPSLPFLQQQIKQEENSIEKKRRKRPGFTNETRRVRRDDTLEQFHEEYADIENVFKRESMRNDLTEKKDAKGGKLRRKRTSSRDESIVSKGIQRQPPTGILLPSISQSTGRTSIDLVFSTYWLPSSQVSLVLLRQDLDCIRSKYSQNLKSFDGNDIIVKCLAERGIDYKLYQEGTSRENVKIPLGQMTVYRIKLQCTCPDDMLPGQPCKNISQHQSWSAHLGGSANGFFRPLRKPATV